MKKRRNGHSRSMTTLTDVALEAGVSEITVSRVIRARGPISEETRKRVQGAIEKVGYVPNRLAGGLASAGSELLAIIIPSHAHAYGDVLRGIDASVSKRGLRTVVSVTDYDTSAERQMVKSLLSWRPTAIVLIGLEHEFETIRLLRSAGTIVVEIMDVDGAAVDIAVGMSHVKAGREMAAFLLDRGHRAFGYIGHNTSRDQRAAKRKQGFVSAIAEAGGRLVGEIVSTGHPPVQVGRAGMAELLNKHPEITAVYFSDDDLAIGGVFHCMAESIPVPGRVAIAGFSGINLGQALPRPLTTTQSLRFEMGSLAGKYIIARVEGQEVPDHTDVGFRLLPGATA